MNSLHRGEHPFQFAVLGAGFGGSLTAWLLSKIGYRVVVIDRQVHPRFALGESSTPIADSVLRELGTRYALPELTQLSAYGLVKKAYPDLGIGLKRGFSYFQHRPGESFVPSSDGSNQLLVAASNSDEQSDTHWYRADLDAWFAKQAEASGVTLLEGTTIKSIRSGGQWSLDVESIDGTTTLIEVPFVIDATGAASLLARHLNIESRTDSLHTNSQAIFAHVRNWPEWQSQLFHYLEATSDYPFQCDNAALHHVIEEGWIWQLAFDNEITSVGIVLDKSESMRGSQANELIDSDSLPADQIWNKVLGRYPSLVSSLQTCRPILDPPAIRKTGRLQFLHAEAAGPDWAMLPSAVGFIDPLHSTGIAHTLWGIRRLLLAIEACSAAQTFSLDAWQNHWPSISNQTVDEFVWLDQLIASAYRTRQDFSAFVTAILFYFTAVVQFEQRRANQTATAFIEADEQALRELGTQAMEFLSEPIQIDDPRIEAWNNLIEAGCRPFNQVGLFNPNSKNMYRHTANPEKSS